MSEDHVSLRDLVERIFDERQDALKELFAAHERAAELTAQALKQRLDQTAISLEQRLTVLNHWREDVVKDREVMRNELLRDRERYLEKAVYSQMHKAIEDRVDALVTDLERIGQTQSRMLGIGSVIVILAAVFGASVAHIFFK